MNALQNRFVGSGCARTVTAAAMVAMLAGSPLALARQDDGADAQRASVSSHEDRAITQAELDQALAGLALFPDALLSQIFIACTYPIEVVQADRWVKANPNLKGDALAAALEAQRWDPSVKSLVNFPDVLASLSENLEATSTIGDAFVTDERRVMDTVQALRRRAQDQGNLTSTDTQRVVIERTPERRTIVIESVRPEVVYVPVYDPVVVYGGWWWPAYTPVVYCRPRYWRDDCVVWWGAPRYCGPAWGYAWGSCNWWSFSISIDIGRNAHCNRYIDRDYWRRDCDRRYGWRDGRGDWRHDGEHRRGLAYRDDRAAREFGGVSRDDTERARENFRPQAEEGRRQIERGDILVAENSQGSSRRGAERGAEGGGVPGSRADERKGSETRASDDRTPSSSGSSSTKGSGSGSGSVARGEEKSDDRKPDSPRASRTPSSSGSGKGSTSGSASPSEGGGGTIGKPSQSAGTVTPGADDRTPTSVGRAGRGSGGRGSSGSSGASPSSGSTGSSSSSPDRPALSSPSGSGSSPSYGSSSGSSSSGASGGSSGREPSPRAGAPSSGSSGSREVSPRASSPSSGGSPPGAYSGGSSSGGGGSSSREASPSRGSSGERGGSSSGSSSSGSAPRGDSGPGSSGSMSAPRGGDSRSSSPSGGGSRGGSGSSGRGGSGRSGSGGN